MNCRRKSRYLSAARAGGGWEKMSCRGLLSRTCANLGAGRGDGGVGSARQIPGSQRRSAAAQTVLGFELTQCTLTS
eukprot:1683832-Prymnesium_polylepis.1